MPFMCQQDSFLTEFRTEVISCAPVTDHNLFKLLSIEKQESKKVYEVVLQDTILFPEGGGQPDDRGFIENAEVVRVIRKGTTAVHYAINDDSSEPLKSEQKVLTKIDWKRRFDHMQQHSAQHLITSIADQKFGFPTTSWWLGSDESYIEMDTKDIAEEQISALEQEVNLKIRECRPVTIDVVELDDPKLKVARGRNLPEDVKGQIRIITMDGVEATVCCGTHVTNLSQLQVIKLMNVMKKKGKCHIYFVCGNRVLNKFGEQFQREQKLMGILKSSPEDLPTAAEKLNISLKNFRKSCQILSKDLAVLDARKLLHDAGESKLLIYHRDNVDLDFSIALLREIGPADGSIVLITLKTEDNSGHLILRDGNVLGKDATTKLGEKLCEILNGKGSLRGNVYQAKVTKLNGVNKAIKFAQEFCRDGKESN